MSNIPTIESIWMQKTGSQLPPHEYEAIIECVKLHVAAALKAATENVFTDCDEDNNIIADKGSILNAYPLENIK
jgi:hypothetical protein